ncbi:hypothetical protein M8C21_023193, partial [Ambrosia artemisiifolia]
NEAGNVPYINLKGYILGNPLTFPEENNYKIRFANGMGLISDELYKSLVHTCQGEYRYEYISENNIECRQNLELYEKLIKLPTQKLLNEHHSASSVYCPIYKSYVVNYWVLEASVREALHTRKGTISEWKRCAENLNFTRTFYDVRPKHQYLSKKGYRSLIYSGDHDMKIPHHSTQAWIRDLNYSVVDQWRSWKVH